MNIHTNPVFVSTVAHATATACARENVASILAKIRDGFYQTQVAQVRSTLAESGKNTSNALKRQLPGVLFSGEFTTRKKSALVCHSGLICADFDHVGTPAALRDQLAIDAHCVSAFLSPSGDGVKALFAVDSVRDHGESWRAVDLHCNATYGVSIDKACKDSVRLCFYSWDSDAYIAAGEVQCVPYPPPVSVAFAAPIAPTSDVLSPGDDYNARGDVVALLKKHGWTTADDEEWTRPGKDSGTSATLGRLDDVPRGFFNFSSNAAPFEAQETYKPFAVYALLEHAGDYGAAACALRELGFGTASPEAKALPLYFDGQSYWRLERDARFGRLGRTDAQLHLKMAGHSPRAPKGVDISPMDKALFEIQRTNRVTYAAPFCGRPAGLYQENGHAILATDSPTIIQAADGNLDALEDFFRDLFGRGQDVHADTQFDVFVGWLQRFRRALANPAQHLPGQALFLIGPASCGKTLAQTIVTHLAGGRSADPSGWIFKNSDFNDGLWGAEVLNLSDANVEDVAGARRKLRDHLKRLTANDQAPCHRKHRGEITLRPVWRVIVSANPDADSATVIPVLDESIADKVIYLRCYPPPVPFPTQSEEGMASFFKSLIDAAPPFLSAVENFDVPADLRGVRFGVREWHHPAIVGMLAGVHPDADLGDRLEPWMAAQDENEVSGSAAVLFDRLSSFHYPNFASTRRTPTYLAQSLQRMTHVPAWAGRISSNRNGPGKQTIWTIKKAVSQALAA